ncbi:MAG TPA: GIY-YIG nuclease family protein [bacterium]|nr:GIY-YIG nuclease family protein [bacterium]HPJ71334.1 GIY-YIG nuclease family protein [bacterium]HPQ66750.1 GIY-YIG nuclease family protein [bacterium]
MDGEGKAVEMKVEASSSPWYVYILRCRDGTLYTGITTNLERRLREHNRGRGGSYTAGRGPAKLVYSEPHPDRSAALKREARIKGWSRRKKERLVTG